MASDALASSPLSRRVDEEHGTPCEGSGAAGVSLVGSSPAPPVPGSPATGQARAPAPTETLDVSVDVAAPPQGLTGKKRNLPVAADASPKQARALIEGRLPLPTEQSQAHTERLVITRIKAVLKGDGGRTEWWGRTTSTQFERLSSDWVKQNFHEWFLRQVQANAGKWVHIPIEKAAPASAAACADRKNSNHGTLEFNPCAVPVQFKQSAKGKGTCVSSGLASAVFAFGCVGPDGKVRDDFDLAAFEKGVYNAVDSDGKPFAARVSATGKAHTLDNVLHTAKFVIDGVDGWTVTDMPMLDPLCDISPYPTLLQIEDSDGDPSHSVTTLGHLIFDGNKRHALDLTKEGLDSCCLDQQDETGAVRATTFHRVVRAYRIAPGKRAQKALKRKASEACLE
jgi:hypothetical protein